MVKNNLEVRRESWESFGCFQKMRKKVFLGEKVKRNENENENEKERHKSEQRISTIIIIILN